MFRPCSGSITVVVVVVVVVVTVVVVASDFGVFERTLRPTPNSGYLIGRLGLVWIWNVLLASTSKTPPKKNNQTPNFR